jgi:hypothetical protein
LLVTGKRVTGFAWSEEVVAGVACKVPYNAEAERKQRGARYEKALLPFLRYAIADRRLVTGKNPFSAKATAKKIVAMLQGRLAKGTIKHENETDFRRCAYARGCDCHRLPDRRGWSGRQYSRHVPAGGGRSVEGHGSADR